MTDRTASASRKRRIAVLPHIIVQAALLVVILGIAFVAPKSSAPIWSLAFIGGALAVAFQVVYGLLGELSLGHPAFFGSAAYVFAFSTTHTDIPIALAAVLGIGAGAVLALAISLLTARLSGAYFSVVTYAFNFIAASLVVAVTFLGQDEGLSGVPSLSDFGALEFNYSQVIYTGLAFMVVLAVLAILRSSTLGTYLEFVRTDSRLAASLGIDHARVRIIATLISGSMAGFVGIVYAEMSRFVSPDVFGLYFVTIPLAAVAIGGRRATYGALIGILVVVVIPLYLNVTPTLNQILGGVLLLLVVVLAPTGLTGISALWRRRGRTRIAASDGVGDLATAIVPRVDASVRTERVTDGPERLRLESATIEFGALRALVDFTLVIREAEIVGLIGPNGAGKSTAVNAIAGLHRLKQGAVFLDGTEITRLSPARRARKGIGRTFQNNLLAEDLTVRRSLRAALAKGRFVRIPQDDVVALAERFGLARLLDRKVASLGFLERRLLSITLAAAAEPGVLILDEATAGLAADERAAIAFAVREVARFGAGVLVIEHDIDFVVNLVDRIVVMDRGRYLTSGTPSEVVSDPVVIETYLGVADDT